MHILPNVWLVGKGKAQNTGVLHTQVTQTTYEYLFTFGWKSIIYLLFKLLFTTINLISISKVVFTDKIHKMINNFKLSINV